MIFTAHPGQNKVMQLTATSKIGSKFNFFLSLMTVPGPGSEMTWSIFLEGRDGGVKAVHSDRKNGSTCDRRQQRNTMSFQATSSALLSMHVKLCFCRAIALSKVKGTPKLREKTELWTSTPLGTRTHLPVLCHMQVKHKPLLPDW